MFFLVRGKRRDAFRIVELIATRNRAFTRALLSAGECVLRLVLSASGPREALASSSRGDRGAVPLQRG
jgi:hypothetical protein